MAPPLTEVADIRFKLTTFADPEGMKGQVGLVSGHILLLQAILNVLFSAYSAITMYLLVPSPFAPGPIHSLEQIGQ